MMLKTGNEQEKPILNSVPVNVAKMQKQVWANVWNLLDFNTMFKAYKKVKNPMFKAYKKVKNPEQIPAISAWINRKNKLYKAIKKAYTLADEIRKFIIYSFQKIYHMNIYPDFEISMDIDGNLEVSFPDTKGKIGRFTKSGIDLDWRSLIAEKFGVPVSVWPSKPVIPLFTVKFGGYKNGKVEPAIHRIKENGKLKYVSRGHLPVPIKSAKRLAEYYSGILKSIENSGKMKSPRELSKYELELAWKGYWEDVGIKRTPQLEYIEKAYHTPHLFKKKINEITSMIMELPPRKRLSYVYDQIGFMELLVDPKLPDPEKSTYIDMMQHLLWFFSNPNVSKAEVNNEVIRWVVEGWIQPFFSRPQIAKSDTLTTKTGGSASSRVTKQPRKTAQNPKRKNRRARTSQNQNTQNRNKTRTKQQRENSNKTRTNQRRASTIKITSPD